MLLNSESFNLRYQWCKFIKVQHYSKSLFYYRKLWLLERAGAEVLCRRGSAKKTIWNWRCKGAEWRS